jgi:hypothetical protein
MKRLIIYASNGERECARRMRQIKAGKLKVENGYKGNGSTIAQSSTV